MPIHEYECEICHNRIERLFKSSEKPPEQVVEFCRQGRRVETFRKIISQSSFRLKGFGWAFDGYTNRPWGKKPYGRAMKEDGYIPGSYIKTGKAQFKEKGEEK